MSEENWIDDALVEQVRDLVYDYTTDGFGKGRTLSGDQVREIVAIAAGSRRAKTPQAVECEASQSGAVKQAHRPKEVSMNTPTDLSVLAERCENLEPDWGEIHRLNDDIHAITPDPKTIIPPDYCRSLDAALTLVPEGFTTGIFTNFGDGGCKAFVGIEVARAATPALALCAAALRARSQENSSGR